MEALPMIFPQWEKWSAGLLRPDNQTNWSSNENYCHRNHCLAGVWFKYQIYCTQIKIHLSGCLNSPSWAAVQQQRASNLLLVLVAKKPLQSREPPDLSRPLSLDQGHIEIVPQLMVHVCPEVSNPKPQDHQLLEISHWWFTCAPSIFTDQSCINVILDPFHLKHVGRLPFWFLVLKLQQNLFFHASLQIFENIITRSEYCQCKVCRQDWRRRWRQGRLQTSFPKVCRNRSYRCLVKLLNLGNFVLLRPCHT